MLQTFEGIYENRQVIFNEMNMILATQTADKE
jgi:hypothetical protein